MDATCFTQNPQKSQNLLDADFFTQNTQKSQNLPEAVIFTLNSQNTQNLPDANMGSLCASQNSADSACKKKASLSPISRNACVSIQKYTSGRFHIILRILRAKTTSL